MSATVMQLSAMQFYSKPPKEPDWLALVVLFGAFLLGTAVSLLVFK